MRVVLGWDGYPTLTEDGSTVLPRDAEMIIRKDWYPNGRYSWPIDPTTGEKIPQESNEDYDDDGKFIG